MTRFFGDGQSILQVFETPITLNTVESGKCHLFSTLLGQISWALAICMHFTEIGIAINIIQYS